MWGRLVERVSSEMKYFVLGGHLNRVFPLTTCRHSDLGSLTLLFYQPIGGLQVLGKDGSWKDVRMVPGTLTVNIADALHFITSKFCPV